MDKIRIQGPCRLEGEVEVAGAKNAVLPIMAAALLTDKECVIRNVPEVSDVYSMIKLLNSLGIQVSKKESTVKIHANKIKTKKADYRYVSTMRASVCLLGPMLARWGTASVSLPGGCVIGSRPIDLHLKGLESLGASILLEHGYVNVRSKQLKGSRIYLGGAFGSSVLATANILMAATLAAGTTHVVNVACEPEISDLGKCLVKMGAKIEGLGSPVVTIKGVRKLSGFDHKVMPDRIEAGTYLIGAAITKGNVLIRNFSGDTLGALIDKLTQSGVKITERNGHLRAKRTGRLHPVSITTHAYPGFPTDLQAQMMALMTVVPGISVITEKIFPDRFMHVSEMNRMGAQIRLEGPSAIVSGTKQLSGAPVMASDLRASAGLILAGLASKGTTEVSRIYHLDRGYQNLVGKLTSLGAKIKRVKS